MIQELRHLHLELTAESEGAISAGPTARERFRKRVEAFMRQLTTHAALVVYSEAYNWIANALLRWEIYCISVFGDTIDLDLPPAKRDLLESKGLSFQESLDCLPYLAAIKLELPHASVSTLMEKHFVGEPGSLSAEQLAISLESVTGAPSKGLLPVEAWDLARIFLQVLSEVKIPNVILHPDILADAVAFPSSASGVFFMDRRQHHRTTHTFLHAKAVPQFWRTLESAIQKDPNTIASDIEEGDSFLDWTAVKSLLEQEE